MPRRRLEIAGRRFQMVNVVSFAYMNGVRSVWKCMCDCGNEFFSEGRNFTSGKRKSCGCTNNKRSATKKSTVQKVIKTNRQRLQDAITLNETNGCWEWKKSTFKGGYGAITINGKQFSAHRASYECFVGEIPEGLHVLHKCDNPRCINPDHLWVGTHKENMLDKMAKGRDNVKGRSFKRITHTDQSGQGHHLASPPL